MLLVKCGRGVSTRNAWVCLKTRSQATVKTRFLLAKMKTIGFAFVLTTGVAVCFLPYRAYAASCDAIVGEWTWFTGGVVTINANGTVVHEPGNDGTWSCTDPARGVVTLRWRLGGYVNILAVSPDGRGLSSTDPSQSFVTAKRLGAAASTPVAPSTKIDATAEATAHFKVGLDYSKKRNWDAAIAEYTKAIGLDPKYALAYINRGAAYTEQGQHDKAILDYTKAITIDPTLVAANYNRASSYFAKGQHDLAISDWSKVIERNPKHAKAHYYRGLAYDQKGQADRALSDLDRAQALGYQVDPVLLTRLRTSAQKNNQPKYTARLGTLKTWLASSRASIRNTTTIRRSSIFLAVCLTMATSRKDIRSALGKISRSLSTTWSAP